MRRKSKRTGTALSIPSISDSNRPTGCARLTRTFDGATHPCATLPHTALYSATLGSITQHNERNCHQIGDSSKARKEQDIEKRICCKPGRKGLYSLRWFA